MPRRRRSCLAPGFVDLQVNGFAGVDFNDPAHSIDEIGRAIDAILATGVTRCLPTVITGPPDRMLASLRKLRLAQTTLPHCRAIAGFHVEGPHIDVADGPRGAHPTEWVRPPDLSELQRWQDATDGNVRLVTLSPHWPDAPQYIAALVRGGIAVSLGHTAANTAANRRRRGRGRDALDASGQCRSQAASKNPELPVGPTRGRPPEREFHRRRTTSG